MCSSHEDFCSHRYMSLPVGSWYPTNRLAAASRSSTAPGHASPSLSSPSDPLSFPKSECSASLADDDVTGGKCFESLIRIVGLCLDTISGSRLGLSSLGSQISCSVIWPISVNWCRDPSRRRLRISATVTALEMARPWALMVRTPCCEGGIDPEDEIAVGVLF